MTISITDLTNQIHTAGHSAIIKQDLRGSLAGGPVNFVITRNNSAPTYVHLLTLNPTSDDPGNIEQYFITHVTIDQAITIRIPKTMTAGELWQRIYQIRLKTMPLPEAHWRQRRQHRDRRHYTEQRRSPHQRYLQRPSKHQPTFQNRQPAYESAS